MTIARTVRQTAVKTVNRDASTIITERAVSITGITMEKAVSRDASEETRITQTTGVRIARTGRMAETTVYRAVLIMEKIVLVFPARTVHRAALAERMKVEEIPEENREASLKARIWNL